MAEAAPHLAPSLQGLLQRALQKNPDDRFATAEQMSNALAAAITELGGYTSRSLAEALVSSFRARYQRAQARLVEDNRLAEEVRIREDGANPAADAGVAPVLRVEAEPAGGAPSAPTPERGASEDRARSARTAPSPAVVAIGLLLLGSGIGLWRWISRAPASRPTAAVAVGSAARDSGAAGWRRTPRRRRMPRWVRRRPAPPSPLTLPRAPRGPGPRAGPG